MAQQERSDTETGTARVGRRGLIAAAAALAVGAAMKETAQPVGATTPGTDFVANGGTAGSPLTYGFDAGSAAAGNFSTGVYGKGNISGVNAVGTNGHGVYASTYAAPGSSAAGVRGNGNGNGTYGVAGYGIFGGTGVYGFDYSGTGVYGSSTSGNGVFGTNNTNTAGKAGGYFSTTASGGTGVAGQVFANVTGAAAFVGAASAGNYAAYFTGETHIVGNFFVSGGAKGAAIKHADGTHRAVYCEEAPESWLTDYGQAKLVGGKADVKIDAEFAGIVKTDNYLVFTSPEGDSNGLYVTNKTAQGFSVREQKGGASSLVFSYRIAVKRSDIAAGRLAKVTLPTHVLLDKLPDDLAHPPQPPSPEKRTPPQP